MQQRTYNGVISRPRCSIRKAGAEPLPRDPLELEHRVMHLNLVTLPWNAGPKTVQKVRPCAMKRTHLLSSLPHLPRLAAYCLGTTPALFPALLFSFAKNSDSPPSSRSLLLASYW